MEATREDQQIRIVNEGLRLALACRVPQFQGCPAGSDQLLQMQQEWSRSLLQTLPPLIDWTEQHRHTLFDEDWGPATLEFQQCFVLVFLEQAMDYWSTIIAFQLRYHDEDGDGLHRRLERFVEDIDRILTKDTNTDLPTSLFHHLESGLRLQGWQSRPVEAHSFYQLILFLRFYLDEENLLLGQRVKLFAVQLGKEMLGFKQNLVHQKQGLELMSLGMKMKPSKRCYAEDSEEILKMALPLSREVANTVYDYSLWTVVYNSFSSIRDVDPSMNDEVMQHLLAVLNGLIIQKASKESYGYGTFAYLNALTMLLLLDVPEVEVMNDDFEQITISGRQLTWDEFLSHSKFHLQSAAKRGSIRFSIDLRIRIGQLVPKLFSGSSAIDMVLFEAGNKCLDVLTWVTLFPIGLTEQQQLARGFMLQRLLGGIKKLCENVVKHRSHYALTQNAVNSLYEKLRSLLRVILQGITQLPDERRFRKLKWNLKRRMGATHVQMRLMNNLAIREEEVEEDL